MDEKAAQQLQSHLRALQRRLRADTPPIEGVSRSAVRVLGVAARQATEDGVRPGRIADELGMTTSNVAAALRELDGAGYVVRTPSDTDGRRVLVSLSRRGAAVVAAHRSLRANGLRELVDSTLTREEQRQLSALIPLLGKLVDEPAGNSRS